jgi:predicted DNA-binding transcriptional regulator YafY
MLPDRFDWPPDFDLKACWAALPARHASVTAYAATVRVSSRVTTDLLQRHGQVVSETDADRDGWRVCRVMFEDDRQALGFLLTLGGAVEVVAPEALRLTVQDYAAQVLRRYGHATPEIVWPAPPTA